MPTPTDLVTDLPADFEVFGQAVDTSMADLKGGTTGQILSKNSNTDMDFIWTSANPGDITAVTVSSPITGGGTSGSVNIAIQDASTTQKGSVQLSDSTSTTSSILAATPTAVKAAYDLAVANSLPSQTGNSGKYLTTNGTAASWGTVSSGAVVQVKSMTTTASTSVTVGNTSDTNLTLSITPTSASNKILVLVSQSLAIYRNASGGVDGTLNLLRNSTDRGRIGRGSWNNFTLSAGNGLTLATVGASFLDSPATTSATTYKTQLTVGTGGTIDTDGQQSITLIEVTP